MAAVAAIKQWQVAPLVVNGKAQPQIFTCTVNFLRGGVALDFSGQPAMNPREENFYRKIRGLYEPRLGQKYKAEKISLSFQEGSPANVVQLLAQVSGIPIQADPSIREKINCDLRGPSLGPGLGTPHGHVRARHHRRRERFASLPSLSRSSGLLAATSRECSRSPPTARSPPWSTVKCTVASSGFGKRLNPISKKEDFHPGIDIAAKEGTQVISAAAGTVTASEFNEQGRQPHRD